MLSKKMAMGIAFFGPIGNAIPILPMVPGFRFYELIVFLGVGYYLYNINEDKKAMKNILLLCPFLLYVMFSALVVSIYRAPESMGDSLILRAVLWISFFIFFICLGERAIKFSKLDKELIIVRYLQGYIVSMFFGYVLFIGYYLGLISFDILEWVEVLPQEGYGLLRFAPGSYANEYGIVSSFALSVMTYILLNSRYIDKVNEKFGGKKIYIVLSLMTFIALFLTTTRAAYVSYFVVLFILIITSKSKKAKIYSLIFMGLIILVLSYIQENIFDFMGILEVGYDAFINNEGSSAERLYMWNMAWGDFVEQYLLGCGYGTLAFLHNIYLQIIFEMGFIGVMLLILPLLYFTYNYIKIKKESSELLIATTYIGLFHVLWFGMSNHNLQHHLTWYVVLLMFLCAKDREYDS